MNGAGSSGSSFINRSIASVATPTVEERSVAGNTIVDGIDDYDESDEEYTSGVDEEYEESADGDAHITVEENSEVHAEVTPLINTESSDATVPVMQNDNMNVNERIISNNEIHPLVINEENPVVNNLNNEAVENRNEEPLGVRDQRRELIRTCYEDYQRNFFQKYNREMLEDHNAEWLEEFGAAAPSLRETILNATELDVDRLTRRGVTLPRTLGRNLDVAELVECIFTAINWADIYGIEMLLVLTKGNEDIIFQAVLEEGRERMTTLHIERANGTADSAMYRCGQLAVLFHTLKLLQASMTEVVTMLPPRAN